MRRQVMVETVPDDSSLMSLLNWCFNLCCKLGCTEHLFIDQIGA